MCNRKKAGKAKSSAATVDKDKSAKCPETKFDEQIRVIDAKTRKPVPNIDFEIKTAKGKVYKGKTDANGLCPRISTEAEEALTAVFTSKYHKFAPSYTFTTNQTPDSVKDVEVAVREVILGIHSNVPASAGLTAGHAWITVKTEGSIQYYGLWPPDHPKVKRLGQQGNASHVRIGYEAGDRPVASRYYSLSADQQQTLDAWLVTQKKWGYTYTCASWASKTVKKVVGENVSSSEILGATGTPRELTKSIESLEKTSPSGTTPIEPGAGGGGGGSSSSW